MVGENFYKKLKEKRKKKNKNYVLKNQANRETSKLRAVRLEIAGEFKKGAKIKRKARIRKVKDEIVFS